MDARLDQLVYETIFRYEGREWRKGSTLWENPTKERGASPHIVGKPCVMCYPKLGGKYQDFLGEWISLETVVDVS